jgi:hypothetical protein
MIIIGVSHRREGSTPLAVGALGQNRPGVEGASSLRPALSAYSGGVEDDYFTDIMIIA